jgi:predicted ATPase
VTGDAPLDGYGLDTACAAWAYGAWCEWLLGYPDVAQERYQLTLSAQEASKQSYTRARALYWCSVVNQFCGDWNGVSELAQIAVENAREHGLPMVVSVSRIMNAAADAALNGAGDQRQEMVEALQAYGATGARFQSPYLRTLIAETMLRENDIDSGLDIITEAEHMVQETGENFFLSEILRLKGELLYAKGNEADKAESCFLKSLEVARSQSAKSLELRTIMSMARILRDRGESSQAFKMLHPVYKWFTAVMRLFTTAKVMTNLQLVPCR